MICPSCGKDVQLVGRPARRLRKHKARGRGPGAQAEECLDSGAYEDEIEARMRASADDGPKPPCGPLSDLLESNWRALRGNPEELRRWHDLATAEIRRRTGTSD